jgi:hypothetical protein
MTLIVTNVTEVDFDVYTLEQDFVESYRNVSTKMTTETCKIGWMGTVNTLHTGLDDKTLQWNHAWVVYEGSKYPMFRVTVVQSKELGRRYFVVDEQNQRDICSVQVTSVNLTNFLEFMESIRYASRR